MELLGEQKPWYVFAPAFSRLCPIITSDAGPRPVFRLPHSGGRSAPWAAVAPARRHLPSPPQWGEAHRGWSTQPKTSETLVPVPAASPKSSVTVSKTLTLSRAAS